MEKCLTIALNLSMFVGKLETFLREIQNAVKTNCKQTPRGFTIPANSPCTGLWETDNFSLAGAETVS